MPEWKALIEKYKSQLKDQQKLEIEKSEESLHSELNHIADKLRNMNVDEIKKIEDSPTIPKMKSNSEIISQD